MKHASLRCLIVVMTGQYVDVRPLGPVLWTSMFQMQQCSAIIMKKEYLLNVFSSSITNFGHLNAWVFSISDRELDV